jgi:hypothetical protein
LTRFGIWLDGIFARERCYVFAAVGASLLTVGIAGSWGLMVQRGAGARNADGSSVPTRLPSQGVNVPQPVQAVLPPSDGGESLSGRERKELRDKLATVTQRLNDAATKAESLKAERAELERSLAAALQRAQSISAERDVQRSASEAADAQVAALRQQLDDSKSKLLTLDAVAAIQEKQTVEAQGRVANLKAELDQLYAARSTAESMIAARNLHIIDVYDDMGKGSGQGAFGRVFYVQGKSLVFYAYDLPSSKRDKNFSFQLWGEGQGLEPTTYQLGVLKPDSTGRGRWVVACDDPKILGQLRGVFIAPPSSKGDPPAPREKMMYAMLGSANHP